MPGCTSTDPSSSGHSAALSQSLFLHASSPPPTQPRHFRPQVRTPCPPGGPLQAPPPLLCPPGPPPAPFLLLFPWEAAQVRGACLPGEGLGAGGRAAPWQAARCGPAGCVPTLGALGARLPFSRTRGGEKAPSRRVKGGRLEPASAGQQRPPGRVSPSKLREAGKEDGEEGLQGEHGGGLCMFSVGAGGQESRESGRRPLHQERTSSMKEALGG